jgi:hypothetical protein
MTIFRATILVLALSFVVTSAGVAQQNDLSTQLTKIAGANANNYLEPLASGLGAGLNSGIYHTADLHNILGFDIGVKVGIVSIANEHKTFDFVLPNQITYVDPTTNTSFTLHENTDYDPVIHNSPTFAGSKTGQPVALKSTSVLYPALGARTIFTTPPGFDYPTLGMIAPQAAIGLPFGIEVIGRFLPSTNLGNAGKVNFIGFGLRYDIDQYIPFCPVDIAVHFMTQKVTVDDKSGNKIMSLGGTAFGAEVSKSLLLFTLYSGFQFESSKLSVENYNYTDPTTGITGQIPGFSINGADKTRFLVGFRMLLAVINLHADYSISKYPVLTLGAGLTFR